MKRIFTYINVALVSILFLTASACFDDVLPGDPTGEVGRNDELQCKENQYKVSKLANTCIACPKKADCYQLFGHPINYSYTYDTFAIRFHLKDIGRALTKVTYKATLYAAKGRNRADGDPPLGRRPSMIRDSLGAPPEQTELRGEATIYAEGTVEILVKRNQLQYYIDQNYNIFEVELKEMRLESRCKGETSHVYQVGAIWYIDEFGQPRNLEKHTCSDLTSQI